MSALTRVVDTLGAVRGLTPARLHAVIAGLPVGTVLRCWDEDGTYAVECSHTEHGWIALFELGAGTLLPESEFLDLLDLSTQIDVLVLPA